MSYSQYVNKQYGERVCSRFPQKNLHRTGKNVNIIEQQVSVVCTWFQRHTERVRQTIVVVTISPPLIALYRISQASPQSALKLAQGENEKGNLQVKMKARGDRRRGAIGFNIRHGQRKQRLGKETILLAEQRR